MIEEYAESFKAITYKSESDFWYVIGNRKGSEFISVKAGKTRNTLEAARFHTKALAAAALKALIEVDSPILDGDIYYIHELKTTVEYSISKEPIGLIAPDSYFNKIGRI